MTTFNIQEAILDTYNRLTGKYYTPDDVVFGEPEMVYSGEPRNATVVVYPKAHTLEVSGIKIAYNKIHYSDLEVFRVIKGSRTGVHQVIEDINTKYGYSFTAEDLGNHPLLDADPDGSCIVPIEFNYGSLGYYGGGRYWDTDYGDPKIETPDKVTTATANLKNVTQVAHISVQESSHHAYIKHQGRGCYTNRYAAVQSDLESREPAYWEFQLVKGHCFVGYSQYDTPMNFLKSDGKHVGTSGSGLYLDTQTGALYWPFYGNVSQDFVRPIKIGEWVGVSTEPEYVTFWIGGESNRLWWPRAYKCRPSASGNSAQTSIIRFNLGYDPMHLTPPPGVRVGVYRTE